MEVTVTLGYGKANLSSMYATYASMKVTEPFNRVSGVTSGRAMGTKTVTQVGSWEHNGALLSASVAHASGTVILLQAKWMRGPSVIRDGGLFLRLRPGAPVYNIIAAVPTGHENQCGDSFVMFAGPADIMTVDELKMVGLEVPRGYVSRFMDHEELAECFRIVKVAEEGIPRPQLSAIATPEGIKIREVAQAPRRRLILRGQK